MRPLKSNDTTILKLNLAGVTISVRTINLHNLVKIGCKMAPLRGMSRFHDLVLPQDHGCNHLGFRKQTVVTSVLFNRPLPNLVEVLQLRLRTHL